jgi:hypothetical protein
MGLTSSLLCAVEDGTSAHILCDCEALVSLGHVHVYLGSFFLGPEDFKNLIMGHKEL